jgi:hypothetical protein
MKKESKAFIFFLFLILSSCLEKPKNTSPQSKIFTNNTFHSFCKNGFDNQIDQILNFMIQKYRKDPKNKDGIEKYIYESLVLLRSQNDSPDLKTVMQYYYSIPKPDIYEAFFRYDLHGSSKRTEYHIYLRPLNASKFKGIMDQIVFDKQLFDSITNINIIRPPETNPHINLGYRRDYVVIGLSLGNDVDGAKNIFNKIKKFTDQKVVRETSVIGFELAPGVHMLPTLRLDTMNNPFQGIARRIYKIIDNHSCLADNNKIIAEIKSILIRDYLQVGLCRP